MPTEKKPKTESNNEEMLRSGKFGTLVGKLCVPAILIMLVMVLYHKADENQNNKNIGQNNQFTNYKFLIMIIMILINIIRININ